MTQENKSSNRTVDTIKLLYKEMKKTGSDSVHFTMNQVFHNGRASAVVSVLEGKKPPHMVLDELFAWAEAMNNTSLINKIKFLENDLSFLEEGEIKP